jgi:hypothetical protein
MDDAPPVYDISELVTDLGHEVYQIDTRMAGYDGITAGYLIRGERPCLVETGTGPSAPVVRDALASLGVGPSDLATTRAAPATSRGCSRRRRLWSTSWARATWPIRPG